MEATSYVPSRSTVSDPIAITGSRQVTIGTSTYLLTEIPSSSLPSSSNANPPPYSHGTLSHHVAMSQIRTAVTRPVVSQVSLGIAESCNFHLNKFEKYSLVQLATGTKKKVVSCVEYCEMFMSQFKNQVKFNVLPLGSYEVLIGMDWL